jgi:TonB family protein
MSDDHADEPHVKPHEIKAQPSDGKSWKWLAGAAAAAIVAVGGYFAIANNGPSQSNANSALNESYSENEATTRAGPLAASSSADEIAPAAAERREARASQAQRRSTARANDVPEEVVGVIPASATVEDGDAIIVPGARRPVWARTPSEWRLSRAYPDRALERGREGEAYLNCTVQNEGALNCVPVSETPVNAGFGAAALRVAHMFRHAPQRRDGSDAVGSPVNLRVVFRIDDENRRRG